MNPMSERTKKILRKICKAIPTVYLAIYVCVWISFVYATQDVASGDKLLMPEYLLSQSQITVYIWYIWLAGSIGVGWLLIRSICNPNRDILCRMDMLERKLNEMESNERESNEGNSESTVGRSVAEKGDEDP